MTGGSGSGKSTVAEALLERYNDIGIVIFAEDGYYWPMSHYGPADTDEQRNAIIERVNYDDPISKETQLMARQLADLKAGRTIEQPIYDYDRHDRKSETLTIAPAPIIILEGIHALSVPEDSSERSFARDRVLCIYEWHKRPLFSFLRPHLSISTGSA